MDAWVFPGQGSQAAGMANGFTGPEAARTFATAAEVLGWDVRAVCMTGSDEYLRETEVAQPAILTVSIAAARTLEAHGHRPDLVAGHSVGEFAALVAAGALGFEDALRGVVARADGMARAGRAHPGGMAAILGLSVERVEDVCARSGAIVANVNAPEQVVISGDAASMERAARDARDAGAKRVIPLNVSVAAHSSLMAPAAEALGRALKEIPFETPMIPFASCATASFHADPAELPSLLTTGVTQRVRWVETVRALEAAGAHRFIEVGPGRALSGLIKRIVPDAELHQACGDEEARMIEGSSHAVR